MKGSYKSAVIMETFAEYFRYGEPLMKLPELEVKMPVGALALAVTAVIFFNFPSEFCSFIIIRSNTLLFYIETTILDTRMKRFT
jgi:hypothetical protein